MKHVLWLAPIHFDPSKDVHPAPWISSLARYLSDRIGLKITMLNYQARLPEPEVVKEELGIRYVFLRTPSPKLDHLTAFRSRISTLNSWIKEHQSEFDLIHIHGSEHQYEACLNGVGLPNVLSMQGVISACFDILPHKLNYTGLNWWMSAQYEKKGMSKVHDFICRTHFDQAFVKKHNPSAQIHINWEMIRPNFFTELGNVESNQVLYMGGTHPIKGIRVLLKAMDQTLEQADLRLVILGKANRKDIQSILKEEDLTRLKMEHIELLGFQGPDGVVAAMKNAFCLLHTSMMDNSPNSVCEAQVGGLPVIAHDVGGISSLIEHGKTGLLAAPKSEAVAHELLALVRNPELYRTLKEESKTMARQRHDADCIAERTMEIYAQLATRDSDTPHIQRAS